MTERQRKYYGSSRGDNTFEAVRLLKAADETMDAERERNLLLRAQVHATLALMMAQAAARAKS